MPRYRLTVAYDGTHFHGWQKQEPPGEEPLRTAQGELELAVRAAVREPVEVRGASRTDAGVHAEGQVAAFTTSLELDPFRMRRAVESRVPEDLAVRAAVLTTDDFDPISMAVEKEYRYTIAHGRKDDAPRPIFDRQFVSQSPESLDAVRMHEAAQHLIGKHDFSSFARLHHGRDSSVRTVTSCRVTTIAPHRIAIDVRGTGFLYNMVRIISGTLMDVGRGRTDPDELPGILAAQERRAAGPTLPPSGLCLRWIRYAGDPHPDDGSEGATA